MFSGRNDTSTSAPGRFLQEARERLVDEAFQRYLDWRDESSSVEAAYRNWTTAPASESALAFVVYTAALDREERAAHHYQALLAEAGR